MILKLSQRLQGWFCVVESIHANGGKLSLHLLRECLQGPISSNAPGDTIQ